MSQQPYKRTPGSQKLNWLLGSVLVLLVASWIGLVGGREGVAEERQGQVGQGKVVAVFGAKVVIDQGAEAGLRKGEQLSVLRGEELKDGAGQVVWRGQREVGALRVLEVQPDKTLAALLSGSVQAGDIVTEANVKEQETEASAGVSTATDHLTTAFLNALNSFVATRNLDRWMEIWADDAEYITPFRHLQSKNAIRDYYQEVLTLQRHLNFSHVWSLIYPFHDDIPFSITRAGSPA